MGKQNVRAAKVPCKGQAVMEFKCFFEPCAWYPSNVEAYNKAPRHAIYDQ